MGLSNIEYAYISELLNSATKSMTKSLMSLKANDVIKAEIVDITPEIIKLKLADNSVINARSLVIPEAKIGQTASFLVKSNVNGQIALEFLKDNACDIPESLVNNILNSFEMPVNKYNSEIVIAMLKNNIPITEENINKVLFFRYSLSDFNIEDSLFLLKENMPATKQTIETFKSVLNNNFLKETMLIFAKNIYEMPQSNEKNVVLENLGIKEEGVDVLNKIIKKLFADDKLIKKNYTEIPNKLKKLDEFFSGINKTEIKDSNVLRSVNCIKNTIDFMKNIDETKLFIQIPILINGKAENCELYVFKNKKGNKKYDKNSSVLLSLNTANLGKTDIFIEKSEFNVRFQFRLEKAEILKIIKNNIKTLELLLKSKGLNLVAVSYIDKNEKFKMLEKNDVKEQKQRFSFDMHV